MTSLLPSRPDLGQLKRQAKDLLRSHSSGSTDACSMLRQLHRFTSATDSEILASDLKLHEVQYALALEYGFSSWNALKHHIESLPPAEMGLVVHRRNGEAWIDGIPRLRWENPGRCTFIGAMVRALNRIGNPIDYDSLMGVSGAAFRFCFAHPRWDFSSVDGMLGYDHGRAALRALGYAGSWVPAEEVREAIVRSIDSGRPALGIDLVGAPEWGVIAGYAEEGRTLLCRTYFDDSSREDYSRSERTPWLNYIIGERGLAPSREEALLTSLRVATTLANGDAFVSGGGTSYLRGFAAMEMWCSDLLEEPRFGPENGDMNADINRFIYDSLIDARGSAARYLQDNTQALDGESREHLAQAANLYSQITAALQSGIQVVPQPDDLETQPWTPEMRAAQVDTLRTVMRLERQAIGLFDRILSAT